MGLFHSKSVIPVLQSYPFVKRAATAAVAHDAGSDGTIAVNLVGEPSHQLASRTSEDHAPNPFRFSKNSPVPLRDVNLFRGFGTFKVHDDKSSDYPTVATIYEKLREMANRDKIFVLTTVQSRRMERGLTQSQLMDIKPQMFIVDSLDGMCLSPVPVTQPTTHIVNDY